MTPFLSEAGHEVVGLDVGWFEPCVFGRAPRVVPVIGNDVREIAAKDLEGIDAIVHLAALSNDPLGDLDPSLTHEINLEGTMRLARAAKEAGVSRFLYSSSCSIYGAAGEDLLDESAAFNPVTPYGVSKVEAEAGLSRLCDDGFSATYLRNSTVYGVSPRLRLDLVLNNLVASAVTSGKVLLLSDGTPWRPVVHVEDVCRAFLAVLEAPRETIHDEPFNVGSGDQNHTVRELAEVVVEAVPGSELAFHPDAGPDKRTYRVDFGKIERQLPGFSTAWTVRDGARELYEAYREVGMTSEDFAGDRFVRLRRIRTLQNEGSLGSDLRWRAAPVAG